VAGPAWLLPLFLSFSSTSFSFLFLLFCFEF
jgi:hypothetical protein